MDYGHHHLVSHHRHRVVEAPSQRLGSGRHDESELGHDVRNPYMTGLDLSGGEERSRSFEPCLKKLMRVLPHPGRDKSRGYAHP
jgi:hypothetical protein